MAGAGAVVARILTQYSDKGSKAAQKDIARLEKKINAFGKKAVASFAVATAAAGAYAVKLGVDSVKAAIEDQKSQQGLANVLRNVTNSTDASIAATEKYISQQQMLTNVSDNELRASLAKLVTVTGDVTSAMDLQSVAIDSAAGSGNSLEAVTGAIAKATQGNFAALKKMFPALDANIVKNKDLGKALLYLDKTYKGTAQQLAKTDPLKSLSIAFGEISEQIGAALLPAVIIFADYVKSDIIPLIQLWVDTNENGLNESLRNSVGKIEEVVEAFKDIYTVLEGVNAILPFGIGGWIKLAIAISGASTALSAAVLIIAKYKAAKVLVNVSRDKAAFEALRAEMGFFRRTATQVLIGLRGISAWAARSTGVIAFLIRGFTMLSKAILMTPWGRIAALVVALGYGIKKLADKFGWFGQGQKKLSKDAQAVENSIKKSAGTYESMDNAVNKLNASKETQNKLTKDEIDRQKRLAAMNAKSLADAKAKAKFEADYNKINDRIAKNFGVKLLSGDDEKLVQINAAEALLKRQDKLDTINKELLKTLKEEVLLMKVKNDLAMRYDDILKALADNKITTQEIQVLALKWGVTIEAVDAYLLQLKIIEDATISDDEIIKLAKSWGSTQAQAAQYLDFFQALNDGILSVAEIDKLKAKWGLTEQQVRQYADFVGVVNDGKLTDAEINKLKDKWKLTTDQVVDYILKIGSPVTYSGSLIDPARAAEIAWKDATAALEAYLALLAKGTGVVVGGSASSSDAAKKAADAAAAAAAKAAADAAAAAMNRNPGNIDEVNAQIAKDQAQLLNEIKNGQTITKSPGQIAAEMADALLADKDATAALGGTAGALSSARYTGQALQYAAKLAAEQKAAAALQSFREAEALSKISKAAEDSALDAQERARIRNMSIANGNVATASGTSFGQASGNTTVNLTVNGSVTTEQDLVASIRQGLLADQVNGKTLTVTAI